MSWVNFDYKQHRLHMNFTVNKPSISLRYHTPNAFSDAIAAARTCYSPNIVLPHQVTEKQKDFIGPLTYNAGHHTIYQHATFEYSMQNVSRHLIWSVLHSFPYYNSDQQSQRYVRLDDIQAYTPNMPEKALVLYQKTIRKCFDTYQRLGETLKNDTLRIMSGIRHADRHPHERLLKSVRLEADKKAIEVARYVLPIATHASLVYTCSGLVLHRLYRSMQTNDVCDEAREVVSQMIDLARHADPDFFSRIGDQPLTFEQGLEHEHIKEALPYDPKSDDLILENHKLTKLLSYTPDAKKLLCTSIRLVLGAGAKNLNDDQLIQKVLDPSCNRYRLEKINLSTHSPLMRVLNHVQYVFYKKLSHSADSQNQRHRTITGSRTWLSLSDTQEPDYFTPMLIKRNDQALEMYQTLMYEILKIKNTLCEMGVKKEDALYILPNALHVRFIESGSLLNFLHRWTLRTCLNAQEEIFHSSMEELNQVFEVHPFLKSWIGPPCVIRNGLITPKCTEGDKFCGVPVWKQFPNVQRQV